MEDVKAYTVAVGNITPFNRKSRMAVAIIAKLEGLYGVHPCPPRGTLLMFKSKNAAKRGRNVLEDKGIICGKNICECYIDARYAKERVTDAKKGKS